MKKLLTSRNHEQVRQLHDFLLRERVPVTVTENGEQLELWVVQASYAAHAKALIQEFKANPSIATSSAAEIGANDNAQITSRQGFWPQLKSQTGPFTLVYALLVILVYIAQNSPWQDSIESALRISDYWEVWPWSQPWRWVTPALLHFSLMHIVFNVFWWVYLGGRFEQRYGSVWLFLAWLVCAVVSNSSQFIVDGPYFGGLSGVVYGLFGLAVVLAWQNRAHPLYLPPGLIGFMLFWLLLGYSGLLWVNVANTAHTAGLVAGLSLGVIMRLLSKRRSTD